MLWVQLRFSLALNLGEGEQLSWVHAVPFPALRETKCAFVILY